MAATETKDEKMRRLFRENGLTAEDVYKHAHYTIITRSGIEKIQYRQGIVIEYDAVTMTPVLCVVKARAHKMEGNDAVRIETFGSAGHNGDGQVQKGKANQYLYYPELAEKRSMSRAVLKLTGFYELGVFGEDEADDFRRKDGEALDGAPPKGKPAAKDEAKPAVAADQGGAAPAQNGAHKPTLKQREAFIRELNNEHVTPQEKAKMLANIEKMDSERMATAHNKLKAEIAKREEAAQNAPKK